jgi:hypothetical protein
MVALYCMVAPVLKNINASLILIVCDVIFCKLTKHITAQLRSGEFGGQKSFGYLEKPL